MMGLEKHERGLLDMIKGRSPGCADPYLEQVAGSPELAMLREIAIFWRSFQIEAQCRLTTRMLKRNGSFERLVAEYFDSHQTSPFIEELTRDFLCHLASHPDPTVAAVAQLEHALLEVQAGSDRQFEILWDRNPDRVVACLNGDGDMPRREIGCRYRMLVAAALPETVICSRQLLEA